MEKQRTWPDGNEIGKGAAARRVRDYHHVSVLICALTELYMPCAGDATAEGGSANVIRLAGGQGAAGERCRLRPQCDGCFIEDPHAMAVSLRIHMTWLLHLRSEYDGCCIILGPTCHGSFIQDPNMTAAVLLGSTCHGCFIQDPNAMAAVLLGSTYDGCCI